jgi:hypothetical protein
LQDLQDSRNVVYQRNVDGLDLGPERKAAVGDHQRVCVAYAADQRVDLRVQYSSFDHDTALKTNLKSTQVCAGTIRQPWRGPPLEDKIIDPVRRAVVSLAAHIAIFVHRIDVGLQLANLRISVQPAVAARNQRLFYVLDGTDQSIGRKFGSI